MGKLVLRTAAEHVRLNRDHGRIGADKLIETSEQRKVDRDKRIETAGGDSGGRRRTRTRRSRPETTESHQSDAPPTQSGRGVNGVQSRPETIESHQAPRLPRNAAAAPTASYALLGLYRRSRQAPRLPRKAAAASTASKAAASTARDYRESPSAAPATQSCRSVNGLQSQGVNGVHSRTTESHQAPRLPRKAAAASTASSAVRKLQRITKRRACHAKQPRPQRRPKPSGDNRGSPNSCAATASKTVLGLCKASSTAPATQSSRSVNSVQSRGVNGVQGHKLTETS